MIVVAGGKGGVGTTTLAVELALAMSRRHRRTLLVDAARGGDAAITCGIEPRHSLADVLAGGARCWKPSSRGRKAWRSFPACGERNERATLRRRPWSGYSNNGRRWGTRPTWCWSMRAMVPAGWPGDVRAMPTPCWR